jgi:hypothetical protein
MIESTTSAGYVALVLAIMAMLFVGMLAMAVGGRRFGKRRVDTDGKSALTGTGIVEGALFALLGLLIAFTFATAYGRYNIRRDLAVEEANIIGTAYLRLDVLSQAAQEPLRKKFRDYVDARLDFWHHLGNSAELAAALDHGRRLQNDIWTLAIDGTADDPGARRLILPELNQMIDITATRLNATQAHPPILVFVMLFVLALVCAWLIGYAMADAKAMNWLHVIGYAAMVTLTIYVILDLEYPRYGLIRLDFAQGALQDVKAGMR